MRAGITAELKKWQPFHLKNLVTSKVWLLLSLLLMMLLVLALMLLMIVVVSVVKGAARSSEAFLFVSVA